MSHKRTPGPWKVALADETTVVSFALQDDGQFVATTYQDLEDYGENYERRAADARLIASAPDLAEALEKISEWAEHTGNADCDRKDAFDRLTVCKELARSALARARGQTE